MIRETPMPFRSLGALALGLVLIGSAQAQTEATSPTVVPPPSPTIYPPLPPKTEAEIQADKRQAEINDAKRRNKPAATAPTKPQDYATEAEKRFQDSLKGNKASPVPAASTNTAAEIEATQRAKQEAAEKAKREAAERIKTAEMAREQERRNKETAERNRRWDEQMKRTMSGICRGC